MNIADRLYISTIAAEAAGMAKKHGLGLEIAEFCTAMNMDTDFEYWDDLTKDKIAGVDRLIFHAPFNELCPAAIDPLIAAIAKKRYEQAYRLMCSYGVHAMVVHSGYSPRAYYDSWFIDKSEAFWREFLQNKPAGFKLFLENTFESSPELLVEIIKRVDDGRLRFCLDAGHAATSGATLTIAGWVKRTAPYLAHVHLHNNYGGRDSHNALGDGTIDIAALIRGISSVSPDTSFTIEASDCQSCIKWLRENSFI